MKYVFVMTILSLIGVANLGVEDVKKEVPVEYIEFTTPLIINSTK